MRITMIATVIAALLAAAPAPASASAPNRTLIAAGDIACTGDELFTASRCHQGETASLTRALRPDAIALLGDIQYERASLSEFRSGFAMSWGRLAYLRPAPGNHEYNTPGASDYYSYFGTRAGPAKRGYYSYDLGAWHIVALNSNCEAVSCAADSAQVRWLRADLARNRARCTLAYWHHPRFSSGENGSYRSTAPLVAALERDRAELVLTGHDHTYERFAPRAGIRHFVVGTGGRSLHTFRRALPGSQRRLLAFGVLALTLRPQGYAWRFVDETRTTRDSGTGTCAQ
ncbi:MAG: metallophosphoesterase family protein [Solirubrobacteraceae bacterium]